MYMLLSPKHFMIYSEIIVINHDTVMIAQYHQYQEKTNPLTPLLYLGALSRQYTHPTAMFMASYYSMQIHVLEMVRDVVRYCSVGDSMKATNKVGDIINQGALKEPDRRQSQVCMLL